MEGLKDTKFKIDIKPKQDAKGKIIPNGVIISSTDIEENIIRPSFYIDFKSNKTNKKLASSRERNAEVQLFYFVKDRDRSKIELLEMQDQLSNIFISNLKVNDEFFIPISECEFDVRKKDGYLTLNIELYTCEMIEKDVNNEPLEELEINLKEEFEW